eukprot:13263994-Ditylum_brightwellii.AAC.1
MEAFQIHSRGCYTAIPRPCYPLMSLTHVIIVSRIGQMSPQFPREMKETNLTTQLQTKVSLQNDVNRPTYCVTINVDYLNVNPIKR